MSSRDERHKMLLDVATDVLLRFGYRKASLDDVAGQAGVSRATVYNYFPNKEELFRAIIVREVERLGEVTGSVGHDCATAEARLLAFIHARFQHLGRMRALYTVTRNVARDVMNFAIQEISALHAHEREALATILRFGVERGEFRPLDPDDIAAVLQAALQGIDESFMFESREPLERGLRPLLEILLAGLRAPEGEGR